MVTSSSVNSQSKGIVKLLCASFQFPSISPHAEISSLHQHQFVLHFVVVVRHFVFLEETFSNRRNLVKPLLSYTSLLPIVLAYKEKAKKDYEKITCIATFNILFMLNSERILCLAAKSLVRPYSKICKI